MESLYSDTNLIETLNILTDKALLGEVQDFAPYADFFKVLGEIPSCNKIYENFNLYCLISALKKFNLDSNVLSILLDAIENNILVHRIYFFNNTEKVLETDSDKNQEDKNTRLQNSGQLYQEIENFPEEGYKIIYTKQKDLNTGETILINKRTVYSPDFKNLKSIFNGLLTSEIKEEEVKND